MYFSVRLCESVSTCSCVCFVCASNSVFVYTYIVAYVHICGGLSVRLKGSIYELMRTCVQARAGMRWVSNII